ncbi:MAG: hypothetical protein IPJ34_15815 [Myxococcales bacterium]|nr:hypothetical protein [Myxococcales bacterium]
MEGAVWQPAHTDLAGWCNTAPMARLFWLLLFAPACTREDPRAIVRTSPTESVPSTSATLPVGLAISADGAPDCNVVMTVPLAPSVTAKFADGAVRLVIGSYSQLPLTATVTATPTTLDVAAKPAGPAAQFCFVPMKITGVVPGPYEVIVTIPHAPRPTDVLRTKVSVP